MFKQSVVHVQNQLYGVRVQIKALQGHPFVILEDSNDKKHEIPAPDPLQFIADDSITTTSDERTSSAANSDDDDEEECEGGVGDNVEEDEDNQHFQKLNTAKPNRPNHQNPTAEAGIEEPGYQAVGYQATAYQANGYQATAPSHSHRQQRSSLDERNSVDNRSKASSQDNNNKENKMFNSQNNNLQNHHQQNHHPQSNHTQNLNHYPQNQNYDHQNQHHNQPQNQQNQQPQNQHQPSQHSNNPGNQYHQNQTHAPRNNNIGVYDERSRSSSGNQQANTARTVTPNIKRSGSSVNVVTRKSAVGTVFALTTSSTKISVSKKTKIKKTTFSQTNSRASKLFVRC